MSGALQSHDIAGSLALPPFGQALDVSLRLVALDGFHRPLVHLKPVREVLDGRNAGVDDADFARAGHSVDRADDPIGQRAEALFALGHQFRSFRHSAPQLDSASMCGNAQKRVPMVGSIHFDGLSRRQFAHAGSLLEQHSADCRARSKISHTNSPLSEVEPTPSAFSSAGGE